MQQQQNPNHLQKGAKHVLSVVTDTILGKIVTVAIAAAVAGFGGVIAVQKNQKADNRVSRPAVSESSRVRSSSDSFRAAAGSSDAGQSRRESSSAAVSADSSESGSPSSRPKDSASEDTQSASNKRADSSSASSSAPSSGETSSASSSQPADSK